MTTYQGFTITHEEDGFAAVNGPVSLGYCDSLDDLLAEIEDHWADYNQYVPVPCDTPSLPEPWWAHR
jgi:hypothetical protein